MQMMTILLATLPLVGVVIGALLQHWLSRSAENRKQLRALRSEAYVDYLRAVAQMAQAKDSGVEREARTAIVAAKTRIAIYGTKNVVAALAHFEATGTLIQEAGRRAFLLIAAAMREGAEPVSSEELYLILFGLQSGKALPNQLSQQTDGSGAAIPPQS